VVRAASASHSAPAAWPCPPYSPPTPGRAPPIAPYDRPQHELVDLAERVLFGLLSHLPDDEDPIPSAEQVIASDVVVWSPTVYATSREALVDALRAPQGGDDALTDVQVWVEAVDVVGTRVYIEWRLAARFTNPCFVDDDLLVEPTGRLVETSGVQVATFRGGQLVRVSCYYDDLALLEQIIT
jgi:hypothetical protein